MPMENQLAHAITQTEYDSSYDKAAKKLLANKQILAQIMKNCVNEYSACSVDKLQRSISKELQKWVQLAFMLMIQTDPRKLLT